MKSLFAALAFLTRIPAPGAGGFDADDVRRAGGWFPLAGALIGGVQALAAMLLRDHLPSGLIGALLVAADVLLTGALHYDGLADAADGFGGGRTREDILRIMRDHAIGSYGGVALVVTGGLKLAAYAALVQRSSGLAALILTPCLGRWSILLLTASLKYARATPSVVEGMGKRSLLGGTCLVLIALLGARSARGWVAAGLVVLASAAFGFYCKRRIGGITGDALGANLELCETAALLGFLWI